MIAPMLAQAADGPFDSAQHLFEVKWDGTRCLAYIEARRLQLVNRRNIEMRDRYPELACLERIEPGTILDGEVVVLDGGKPSFQRLQQREHLQDRKRIAILRERLPATLIVFDILYYAGESLLATPLRERKARLSAAITAFGDPHVIASDFIVERGKAYFNAVEKAGLEGIMAKRLDSPYVPGKRSPHWLKIKVAQTGVFEIVGFTPHETAGDMIGALIIAERVGRRWAYKGKVGSGFTELERREFHTRLSAATPMPPLKDGPKDGVWREAKLRCVVRFFEKTGIGMLRAPVYKGIEANAE